jgi:hypothetical protein
MLVSLYITILIFHLLTLWYALPRRRHHALLFKLQLFVVISLLLLKAHFFYFYGTKPVELAEYQLSGPLVLISDNVNSGTGILASLGSSDFIFNTTGDIGNMEIPWPDLEPDTLVVQHFWHDNSPLIKVFTKYLTSFNPRAILGSLVELVSNPSVKMALMLVLKKFLMVVVVVWVAVKSAGF